MSEQASQYALELRAVRKSFGKADRSRFRDVLDRVLRRVSTVDNRG